MYKREVIPVVADVTDLASLIQIAQRLESRLGPVDVLTGIAGVT